MFGCQEKVYICMYIYINMHTYIYIYTHKHIDVMHQHRTTPKEQPPGGAKTFPEAVKYIYIYVLFLFELETIKGAPT